MARLKRIAPKGVAQHIIQRGNNRQVIFAGDADMKAYLNWLKEYSQKYKVEIHAWVLMTNHVHLLCTPQADKAISQMMQAVGRMYVRYFNYTYQRTGTLWEGRFKACLVQNERYLLTLYRYIELNPVRAGMVESPSDYNWSSYGINALGTSSELQTPHPEYIALGKNKKQRLMNYQALFKTVISESQLKEIRGNTNRGLALADTRFTQEIEALYGCRISKAVIGRPKKINTNDSALLE